VYREPHNFNVGDLLVNKTAMVLFSSDIEVLYYGLFFIEVEKDEILLVVDVSDIHVTVLTERGTVGWQAGYHFEILQKANKS
jgi:hypothetical protein